ncbi:MAG: phage portal protein [Pseudomonadales bacterium]|nr:phage portal protein [Pseudomonadales bacterium]|tara:strand:+ start:4188 stop:5324 length:1137 start_codon:yes stop_codon:yes gene_type:complete
MRELEAQAKALAPIMTGIVAGVRDELRKEFADQMRVRDDRIAELQKALAERPDLDAIAKQAAALVPTPDKGKDADPEVIKRMVADAVAALPAPEPGEDGKSITAEDVQPMLSELVKSAVAELPPAKDGESVTVEDVQPMLLELVKSAVAELPPAEPGKDADMDEIKRHLEQLVKGIEPAPAPSAEEVGVVFERRFSDLALSLERQARDIVDKAVDRIPVPQDGKDALDIDVLPAINEERSYCKGTFASHNGGIWIARRKTHGMDGWECIVNGWASTEIITFSERGFEVSVTDALGQKTTKRIDIPSMIYRGVFTPGMHHPGDMVTFGGSLWHCNEPTDKKPGEPGCKAWTLAAKRGRDGKDLRPSASTHDPDKGVKLK